MKKAAALGGGGGGRGGGVELIAIGKMIQNCISIWVNKTEKTRTENTEYITYNKVPIFCNLYSKTSFLDFIFDLLMSYEQYKKWGKLYKFWF